MGSSKIKRVTKYDFDTYLTIPRIHKILVDRVNTLPFDKILEDRVNTLPNYKRLVDRVNTLPFDKILVDIV